MPRQVRGRANHASNFYRKHLSLYMLLNAHARRNHRAHALPIGVAWASDFIYDALKAMRLKHDSAVEIRRE